MSSAPLGLTSRPDPTRPHLSLPGVPSGADDFLDLGAEADPWPYNDQMADGQDTIFGVAPDPLDQSRAQDAADLAEVLRAFRIVLAEGEGDTSSAVPVPLPRRAAPPVVRQDGTDAFEFRFAGQAVTQPAGARTGADPAQTSPGWGRSGVAAR